MRDRVMSAILKYMTQLSQTNFIRRVTIDIANKYVVIYIYIYLEANRKIIR